MTSERPLTVGVVVRVAYRLFRGLTKVRTEVPPYSIHTVTWYCMYIRRRLTAYPQSFLPDWFSQ
jgi:hypothetical protein